MDCRADVWRREDVESYQTGRGGCNERNFVDGLQESWQGNVWSLRIWSSLVEDVC